MSLPRLSAREMQPCDIPLIADYWSNAAPEYLLGMGADPGKIPERAALEAMLAAQLEQPYNKKQSYCTIWEIEGRPVGHCNVNKIIYGQEAYMHLHLWHTDHRQQGAGVALIQLSLPYFFCNLQLQTLYCEPYALNPAPNKALEKAGFQFVKKHTTIPNVLNFLQEVCLWQLQSPSGQDV